MFVSFDDGLQELTGPIVVFVKVSDHFGEGKKSGQIGHRHQEYRREASKLLRNYAFVKESGLKTSVIARSETTKQSVLAGY
jgi:hypothetical protein